MDNDDFDIGALDNLDIDTALANADKKQQEMDDQFAELLDGEEDDDCAGGACKI